MRDDSCQHYRIDNRTWQCETCGLRMVQVTIEPETVLSAPNLAGCTVPGCTGMDDPRCQNPTGLYIPGSATPVVIGQSYTYECDRCGYGTVITSDGVQLDCGSDHRGDLVRARQP